MTLSISNSTITAVRDNVKRQLVTLHASREVDKTLCNDTCHLM